MRQVTKPTTKKGGPHYHMTQLASYSLINVRESLLKGNETARNLQDLARDFRDKFIQLANTRVQAEEGNRRKVNGGLLLMSMMKA